MKNLILYIIAAVLSCLAPKSIFAQDSKELEKVNIRVRNMTCDGDMPTIKTELLKKEGVMDVSFTKRQYETAVFTIKYHNGTVDRSAIEGFIEQTPGCDDKSTKPYRVIREKAKKEKK